MKFRTYFLHLTILLLCLLLCFDVEQGRGSEPVSSPDFSGAPFFFPPLKTDMDKLRVLVWINETMPGFFEQATRFGINYLEFFDHNQELLKVLQHNPAFKKGIKAKKFFATLTATTRTTVRTKQYHLVPEALANLKTELTHMYNTQTRETPMDRNDLKNILALHFQQIISELGSASSESLLTGLIMTLQESSRKQVFSERSVSEKIKSLVEQLPEVFPDSFDHRAQGFVHRPTVQEAILRVNELIGYENEAKHLLTLYSVLNQHQEIHLEDIPTYLADLTEAEVMGALDEVSRNGALQELLKESPKSVIKKYSRLFEQSLIAVSAKSYVTEEGIRGWIRIQEVPEFLAALKGIPAGGCQSKKSFGFSYDPWERGFYIFDDAGKLKGEVSGTMVKEDGKNSYYISDLSGPRISSADTMLVLHSLHQARGQLGFEQVVLPSTDYFNLFNFAPIRNVIEELTDGRPKVKITYKTEVRSLIENFKSKFNIDTYDHAASNTHGIIFQPEKELSIDLHIEHKPRKPIELPDRISPTEVWKLCLNLDYTNNIQDIDRLLKLGIINKRDFSALQQILLNIREVPIGTTEQRLQHLAHSIGLPKNYFDTHAFLTYRGRMNSSNALSQAHRLKTIEIMTTVLLNIDKPYDAASFIAYHSRIFKRSRYFQNFISKLISRSSDAEVYRRIHWLVDMFPEAISPTTIRKYFKHVNPAVRRSAVTMMGRIASYSPEKINKESYAGMKHLLNDSDELVQAGSVWALGKALQNKTAEETLILKLHKLLDSETAYLVSRTINTLSIFHMRKELNEEITHDIFSKIDDARVSVAIAAISFARNEWKNGDVPLGDDYEKLVSQLHHPNKNVRTLTTQTLLELSRWYPIDAETVLQLFRLALQDVPKKSFGIEKLESSIVDLAETVALWTPEESKVDANLKKLKSTARTVLLATQTDNLPKVLPLAQSLLAVDPQDTETHYVIHRLYLKERYDDSMHRFLDLLSSLDHPWLKQGTAGIKSSDENVRLRNVSKYFSHVKLEEDSIQRLNNILQNDSSEFVRLLALDILGNNAVAEYIFPLLLSEHSFVQATAVRALESLPFSEHAFIQELHRWTTVKNETIIRRLFAHNFIRERVSTSLAGAGVYLFPAQIRSHSLYEYATHLEAKEPRCRLFNLLERAAQKQLRKKK